MHRQLKRLSRWRTMPLSLAAALLGRVACGAEVPPAAAKPPEDEVSRAMRGVFIREYRVVGTQKLTEKEIGEAVYPFLGPGRTEEDVEQARAALENVYKEKGFQTVSVQVPPQQMRRGIVILQAVEAKVGQLRVKGSRYFSLAEIKRRAPSLAPGTVPNFNDVTRDIVALNGLPDRRVTPEMRAGVEPGTVDVDLVVKDTLPLHGSLELNNRYSPDTTELRLNGSISYANLWQRGHAFGLSFQIAPERLDDAKVFSGYYLARFESLPSLSLILSGTKQDSNVSTLGGSAVAGRGEILGARALITLPAREEFYHTLSLGFDYKHFDEDVNLAGTITATPITYYPFTLGYNATWAGKKATTELGANLVLGFRGTGSDSAEFEAKRFRADGNFIYFRGDLAHTRDLPRGLELFAKVQGQIASQPLINSEQFSGGGIGTARGYLESAALGDNGLFGSLELRSPSLLGEKNGEWRFYAFVDAGVLTLREALPEQEDRFELASLGLGSRIQFREHFNGSIDAGYPLTDVASSDTGDLLVTFRLWADF
jgi:hemolysin activation/secretion protein